MLQNYIEYIKVGVHMRYTRKNFISFVLVPSLLWPLFGAIPFGLLLSGYYELLSIAMITAGVTLLGSVEEFADILTDIEYYL